MRWFWRKERNWGLTLLAVWLIASGLVSLANIAVAHVGQILAAIAVAAGILLLMRR